MDRCTPGGVQGVLLSLFQAITEIQESRKNGMAPVFVCVQRSALSLIFSNGFV